MTEPDDPTPSSAAEPAAVGLDELADLQAGLLTPRESAALQARVDTDPAAQSLLADLEHTVALLADLAPDPVPDDIAARIDAALLAEISPTAGEAPAAGAGKHDTDQARGAQVIDLRAARSRAPLRWQSVALLASAAAAIGVLVVGGVLSGMRPAAPQAGSAPVTPTIAYSDLGAQWPAVQGFRDYGFLSSPETLEECMGTTIGMTPDRTTVLGARPVIVDGEYGVLIAAPSDDNQVILTVFGPSCANTSFNVPPDVIAQTYVPR